MAEGIEIRTDGRGRTTYRARIWSNRDDKRIAKAFPTMAAAKSWRRDSLKALEQGTLRPPTRQMVEEAMEAWLEGARAGLIRNRSGDPYKPSALRSYERSFRLRVKDELDRPFPPGPRGHEEHDVPGAALTFTPEQARSVAGLADRCSHVEVEDRGSTYKQVRMFDAEGQKIGERRIFPDGRYGHENLP
jgi:hypothetical protein